jgi:hypothetical protein
MNALIGEETMNTELMKNSPWESEFPFEAWGATCRLVLETQPTEGEKYPYYRAVSHTAKLAACSMVIDANPPKTAEITVPRVTMALDENTVTSHGTWVVDFKTRNATEEGHARFFEELNLPIAPPSTGFASQWMAAWMEREQDGNDLADVFDESDRTLGLWVYGAMCAYLSVAQQSQVVRAAMFQDTATHWIARTIKSNKHQDVCLLPGLADVVIQKTEAMSGFAFPSTVH